MEESRPRKQYMRHALVYVAPLVCLVTLGVVLNSTNPLQSGPLVILVVFVLLYLLVLSVLCAILRLVHTVMSVLRPRHSFSLRRGYYIMSVISLGPVLLVALNTLGQLEAVEVILVGILVALGCFYVFRRTIK